jgi:succinate dehydrogenase / fumarate reductase cytochrome b subunit
MGRQRPLSPHLGIYRKQITSVMSIFHRITGIVLSGGMLLIAAWLWAAAYSEDCFSWMYNLLTSLPGKLFLIAWSLAFFYHLSNGIRHLYWDAGKGLTIPSVYTSGRVALILTVALTAGVWYLAFNS